MEVVAVGAGVIDQIVMKLTIAPNRPVSSAKRQKTRRAR
jgi:hypothetical protein